MLFRHLYSNKKQLVIWAWLPSYDPAQLLDWILGYSPGAGRGYRHLGCYVGTRALQAPAALLLHAASADAFVFPILEKGG